MPTVGVVEWSLAGGAPATATIVYTLKDADGVDRQPRWGGPGRPRQAQLSNPAPRPQAVQGLHVPHRGHARRKDLRQPGLCPPHHGQLRRTRAPVTVTVARADKREPGFIVTSSGTFVPSSAFIIDADGDVVWYVDAPLNPTRAQMDYEGDNMWMVSLNLDNVGRGDALRLDGRGARAAERRRAGTRTPRLHGDARGQGRRAGLARSGHHRSRERSRDSLTGRYGHQPLHDRKQPVPVGHVSRERAPLPSVRRQLHDRGSQSQRAREGERDGNPAMAAGRAVRRGARGRQLRPSGLAGRSRSSPARRRYVRGVQQHVRERRPMSSSSS